MKSRTELKWAAALAASIVLGILLAWSPRYWRIATLHSAILAIGLLWLFRSTRFASGKFSFPPAGIAVVFLGLWGWVQILAGWSIAPYATLPKALDWTVAAFTFFLSVQIFRTSSATDLFLKILIWAAGIFAILAVLQAYTSPEQVLWIFPAEPRSIGTFLYKNHFASLMELTAPIALYQLFFRNQDRWVSMALFGVLFGGTAVSASRTGTILLIAEFAVILLIAWLKNRVAIKPLLILLPATVCACLALAWLFGTEQIIEHFREPHPYVLREELLKSTFPMIRLHPITGSGLNTWSLIYPRFATFDIGALANAAHNDWAEWTEEGGVFFSLAIASLVLLLLKPAIESIWGLGIVAIMLHSWVDYPTREPVILMLWFCMAGALAATSLVRRQRRNSAGRSAGKNE